MNNTYIHTSNKGCNQHGGRRHAEARLGGIVISA